MTKRRVPVKSILFLCVSMFVLSLAKDIPDSTAFLKGSTSKATLTSAGDLSVELVDDMSTGNGDLTISSNHSRDLYVKNKGDAAMFVRVLIHPTLENPAGIQRILDRSTFIPVTTSDWVDGKDGYYYYKKKILANTRTNTPIFDKFVAMTGLEVTELLTLHFKVEAITTKGDTYRDAWWEGEQPSATKRAPLMALDTALQAEKD